MDLIETKHHVPALLCHAEKADKARSSSTEESTPQTNAGASKPRRRSFKESKELKELDRQLPELETRKAELEAALSAGSSNLSDLSQELASLLDTLATAEERWLELSELAP